MQGTSQPQQHGEQGGMQSHAHCRSAHRRPSNKGDRAPSQGPAEALPVCSTQVLTITWRCRPQSPSERSPPLEADREGAGGNCWGALWEGFLEAVPQVREGTAAGLGGVASVLPRRPTACPQGDWLSRSPTLPTSTPGASGEGSWEGRGHRGRGTGALLGAVLSGPRCLIRPLGHFLLGPDLRPEARPIPLWLPAVWVLRGWGAGRGRGGRAGPEL